MSSLAAARADNFYQPPDWDPRKQSRAEHAAGGGRKLTKEEKWKAHPLGVRAKKLATEGVLTIRFEMPFNVRCCGCDNHIGKGVRYNAEKRTVGKYFSTSIYAFRMLCHCEDGTSRTCQRRNPHWIEIHTDPKNADYVIVEGAVRVAEPSPEDAESLGVERTLDAEEAAKRSANPFYRLEATGDAASQRKPWLMRLQDQREDRYADDYEANRAMRRAHRSQRKESFLQAAVNEAKGIRVPLLPEHPADVAVAQAAPLQAARRASDMRASQRGLQLASSSIFGGKYAVAPAQGQMQREAQQWQTLQVRHERGMRITAAPAPAPPSKRPFQHMPIGGGGAVAAAVTAATAAAAAAAAAELHAAGSSSDDEDGDAHEATRAPCPVVGSKRERAPNQSLVAYSDSDDEGAGDDG